MKTTNSIVEITETLHVRKCSDGALLKSHLHHFPILGLTKKNHPFSIANSKAVYSMYVRV